MPNSNYIKGRNKEYKIMKQLREEGFDIVQRSAGSHSKIDIFAINVNERRIKFIQSKPDDYSESAIDKLMNDLSSLNNIFRCSFDVI
jgi:Holliday junction resolvase